MWREADPRASEYLSPRLVGTVMNGPDRGHRGRHRQRQEWVADELVKQGGHLITADKLGHEALRQVDIREKVIERWGRELLDATGEIQRRALGRIVFADAAELRELEAMVFPFIGKRIHEEIARANQDPGRGSSSWMRRS